LIHLRESEGFSLIEVLVALVILSIALLALAGLMATTTGNNAGGGHLTEAATVAQDALERLRVSPLNKIPVGIMIPDTFVGSNSGIKYTRKWIATANVPPPNNTFDTINITVTWVDEKSQNHLISMVSGISQQ